MNSQTSQRANISNSDEAAISAIPLQLAEAWNRGSGEDFAAPFAEQADFIAFEGTHLKGRREIALFHQQIFDTTVKGSRIEGEVKFVRFLSPELAVMHSIVRVTLPGRTEFSPGRDSMQIFVVAKRDGEWRAEALLKARKVTLGRQYFLDDLDSLPAESQRQVSEFVASLKQQR